MEDKHIYTTSNWTKLKDKLNYLFKEIKETSKNLLPKKSKPTISQTITKKEDRIKIQQTSISQSVIKNRPPKPKFEKIRKTKEEIKHLRKLDQETSLKILSIGLSVLIILIFGLGIFLTYKNNLNKKANSRISTKGNFTQTTPSSNWKIYSNNQYQFSFKYPTYYQIQESNLGNGDFKVFLVTNPMEQTARGITVINNQTLPEVIEKIKTNQKQGEQIIEEKSIVIDNNNAKLFVTKTIKGPEKANIILIEKYNKIYRFDWLDNQILATFKFIE